MDVGTNDTFNFIYILVYTVFFLMAGFCVQIRYIFKDRASNDDEQDAVVL